jgi:hypothetical protein
VCVCVNAGQEVETTLDGKSEAPSAYIPPHLRGKTAPSSSSSSSSSSSNPSLLPSVLGKPTHKVNMPLRRRIQGLMNRVDQSTLDRTANEFSTLFQEHSRNAVVQELSAVVRACESVHAILSDICMSACRCAHA